MEAESSTALIEHLFRHEAGRLQARLVRAFGLGRLDLAEDAVQHAMVQALRHWRYGGVPANPRAWLFRVARNRAIDLLRAAGRLDATGDAALADLAAADTAEDPRFAHEIADERLALLFACGHPALTPSARLALMLKHGCGFGTAEIARALLSTDIAIAQRLTRARGQLAALETTLEVPGPEALAARLPSVEEAIYLLFTEGVATACGEEAMRAELCHEAIRLAELVIANGRTATPAGHALAALLCLHAARLPARLDAEGDLLLLDAQDRRRWDRTLIARGFRHLAASASGDRLSRWHAEAAIAAAHAAAPTWSDTDWRSIVSLYDDLLAIDPRPVAMLNRAAAIALADGPESGLAAVRALENVRALARYPLRLAVEADCLARLGRRAEADDRLRMALGFTTNEAERRLLERRLATAPSPLIPPDAGAPLPPD